MCVVCLCLSQRRGVVNKETVCVCVGSGVSWRVACVASSHVVSCRVVSFRSFVRSSAIVLRVRVPRRLVPSFLNHVK